MVKNNRQTMKISNKYFYSIIILNCHAVLSAGVFLSFIFHILSFTLAILPGIQMQIKMTKLGEPAPDSLTHSLFIKSSTSFGWGKGGNVTSAGWQVTLCDPIWYVSFCSGDGRPVCKLLYAFYTLYLFTLFTLLSTNYCNNDYENKKVTYEIRQKQQIKTYKLVLTLRTAWYCLKKLI